MVKKRTKNNPFKDLNLIVYRTIDVFSDFGISTKHHPVKMRFCVIDIDKHLIKEVFETKAEAFEYVNQLINRIFIKHRLDQEQLH